MQVSYFHLTSAIQAGKTVNFKYVPLRRCASLFSLRGRCQKVRYEQDNLIFKGLVVADQLSKPKPLTISQGMIIVAKIILIATLVVPLLALIGAKIFSANNPIIYERQVKVINDKIAAIRKQEKTESEERLGKIENEKNNLKEALIKIEKAFIEQERKLKSDLNQAKNKIMCLGEQVVSQANEIDALKLQETQSTVLKPQSLESSSFVLGSEDKDKLPSSLNGFSAPSSPIIRPLPLSSSSPLSRSLPRSSLLSSREDSNEGAETESCETISMMQEYLTVHNEPDRKKDLSRSPSLSSSHSPPLSDTEAESKEESITSSISLGPHGAGRSPSQISRSSSSSSSPMRSPSSPRSPSSLPPSDSSSNRDGRSIFASVALTQAAEALQRDKANQDGIGTVEDFEKIHKSGKTAEQIKAAIKSGYELYKWLSEAQGPIKEVVENWYKGKSKDEIREAHASFIWFLHAKAVDKRQGFVDGAYTVPNLDGKLSTFFACSPVGMERSSTHLQWHQTGLKMGINIPKRDLPAGLGHILIQEIGNTGRLFIKPERYGIMGKLSSRDIYETWMHAHELAWSLLRKAGNIIPQIQPYVGSDDAPGNRKERIPEAERQMFVKMVTDLEGAKQAIQKVGSGGSGEGIQAMVRYVNNLMSVLEAFIKMLESKYDHLKIRFGQEVIFTHEGLMAPFKSCEISQSELSG